MSTVIKAGQAGRVLQRLSTVDLADHLAEARAVLTDAERRAAQIIAHAERDAERLREEAHQGGYQAGHDQGYAEGTATGHQAGLQESVARFDEQQSALVSAMDRVIAEIDALKQDLAIAAENDLLEFAVSVARRLTFAIGELYPESATENLLRALRLVGSKTDLTVRVHPQDVAAMKTFAESVLQRMDGSRAVNLVADDSVAPGGCRVQSAQAEVDASLETQVDEMVALLLGDKAKNG